MLNIAFSHFVCSGGCVVPHHCSFLFQTFLLWKISNKYKTRKKRDDKPYIFAQLHQLSAHLCWTHCATRGPLILLPFLFTSFRLEPVSKNPLPTFFSASFILSKYSVPPLLQRKCPSLESYLKLSYPLFSRSRRLLGS